MPTPFFVYNTHMNFAVVGQFERNLNHIGHSAHRMKHIVYVIPIAIGTMFLLCLMWFKKHFQAPGFQTDPLPTLLNLRN